MTIRTDKSAFKDMWKLLVRVAASSALEIYYEVVVTPSFVHLLKGIPGLPKRGKHSLCATGIKEGVSFYIGSGDQLAGKSCALDGMLCGYGVIAAVYFCIQ